MRSSSRFENLVTAVGSFLSRLDENSVATLVAGLTDCPNFHPFDVSTANTLVSYLDCFHNGTTVIARYVAIWIVLFSVCAVAGAALVECKPVRHRAADLPALLQSAHRKIGP